MSAQWYYTNNGQQKGPVTDVELKQLAVSGNLIPADQVWKDGMAAWTNAGNLKGLFQPISSIPQIPSPPQMPKQIPPLNTTTDYPIENGPAQSNSKLSYLKSINGESIKQKATATLAYANDQFNKQTMRNKLIISIGAFFAFSLFLWITYGMFFGYSTPYSSICASIEKFRMAKNAEFLQKYKDEDKIPQLELKSSFEKIKAEADKLLQDITPLPYTIDKSISDSISEIKVEKSTFDSAGIFGAYFVIDLKFKSKKPLEYSTGINVRFMDSKGAMIDEHEVRLFSISQKTRPGELVNAKVNLDFPDAPKAVKMIFESKR